MQTNKILLMERGNIVAEKVRELKKRLGVN